jgi:hypothetical protein
VILLHPKDYRAVRNLGTLVLELGERAARDLLADPFAMAWARSLAFDLERRG